MHAVGALRKSLIVVIVSSSVDLQTCWPVREGEEAALGEGHKKVSSGRSKGQA